MKRELFLQEIGKLIELFELSLLEAKKEAWDKGYNAAIGDEAMPAKGQTRSTNPYIG